MALGIDVLTQDEAKYVPFAQDLLRKLKILQKLQRGTGVSRTWQFDGVTIYISTNPWNDFIKIRAAGDPFISTVLAAGQAASEVANTIANDSITTTFPEHSWGIFSIWVKHPDTEIDGDAFNVRITDSQRPSTGWTFSGGPKTGIYAEWDPDPADGGGENAAFTVTTDAAVTYQPGWTNYLLAWNTIGPLLFGEEVEAWFYMNDAAVPITVVSSSGFGTIVPAQVNPDINIEFSNGYCFAGMQYAPDVTFVPDLDTESYRRYFINDSGLAAPQLNFGWGPSFDNGTPKLSALFKLANPGANASGLGSLGNSYYYNGAILTAQNFKACNGTPYPPE